MPTRSAPRPGSGCSKQATLAIRARVPLPVLRDVIQPFPAFSDIYVAALKALRTQITAAREPATQGPP